MVDSRAIAANLHTNIVPAAQGRRRVLADDSSVHVLLWLELFILWVAASYELINVGGKNEAWMKEGHLA